jgi:hypothetical protein
MLETRLEDSNHDRALKITQSRPSWALSPCHSPFPEHTGNDHRPHPQTSLLGTVRFRQDHSVLVLKGHIVDSVSFSKSTIWVPTSAMIEVYDAAYLKFSSRRLLNLKEVLENLGVSVEHAASLCRAIVASSEWAPCSLNGHLSEKDYALSFFLYYRLTSNMLRHETWPDDLNSHLKTTLEQCEELISDLASLFMDQSRLDTFDPGSDLTGEENGLAQDVWDRATEHGRSFCVTKAARFCNVMYQAEEGDIFAAFQGSDVLFLLRPVGTQYRLIGDAYVDGLMNGEAYEGHDFNEVDYDIELI